ncbi:MAG TPA: hypothetical protein VFL99_16915 [Segeticoccus sp.]|uniref:hypothetical protein n=1 Tax=Segeticoccus sp. TaxID=2706531 RepID=UPI002D7EDAB0|nr:hypothetical protein [Segeticoccus sp.]HET8602009.1 hypothetical protein [Segeticoccus sp.]
MRLGKALAVGVVEETAHDENIVRDERTDQRMTATERVAAAEAGSVPEPVGPVGATAERQDDAELTRDGAATAPLPR